MRTTNHLLVAALAACLVGSTVALPPLEFEFLYVVSLRPLLTEQEAAFEPGLLGTWVDADAEVTMTFERLGENGYEWTVTEFFAPGQEEETSQLRVRLVHLGKALFLDSYPTDLGALPERVSYEHLVRAHTFWQIRIENDSLQMALLDADWLANRIEEGEIDIAHVVLLNQFVLTAPTEKLQSLFSKYADEEKAFPFSVGLGLRRQTEQ